jgi:uncharacterized protein YeaO (DUF488 family)
VSIRLKRVYDEPVKSDGHRILVDRLWPRGVNKKKARVDQWLEDVAPSTKLRKWFAHDPGKWKEFKKRYTAELDVHHEQVKKLLREARKRTVTLLFSAKDTEHNNAVALKDYIERLC